MRLIKIRRMISNRSLACLIREQLEVLKWNRNQQLKKKASKNQLMRRNNQKKRQAVDGGCHHSFPEVEILMPAKKISIRVRHLGRLNKRKKQTLASE